MLIRYLISTIILGLCLTTTSFAEEQPAKDIDYAYGEEDFSPCGVSQTDQDVNALPTPQETAVGEVSYVTGGTCSDEVRFMKSIAPQFPLEIVMVENEAGREIYIADVHIALTDSQQEQVLNVVTEGPFLLVKLPTGEYQVTANFRGVEQVKKIRIEADKHRRVVFVWEPAKEAQAD